MCLQIYKTRIFILRLLLFTCIDSDLVKWQGGEGDGCDYGAIVYNDWCYSSENITEQYHIAVDMCRDSGGDLVSIHDENVRFSLNFPNVFPREFVHSQSTFPENSRENLAKQGTFLSKVRYHCLFALTLGISIRPFNTVDFRNH